MRAGEDYFDSIDASNAERAREMRTRESMNNLCQKVDRIISGSSSLTVKPAMHVDIAATSGQTIYLNHDKIADLSHHGDFMDRLGMVLAFNIHELGHYQYTPGLGHAVWGAKMAHDEIRTAFNALEDQRQELLMSVRYPRARDYHRLAIGRVLKDSLPDIPVQTFVITYGRRHILPSALIANLRAQFVKVYSEAVAQKVEQIIDEFVTISATDKDNMVRMAELAEQLSKLVPNLSAPQCATNGLGAAKKQKEQNDLANQGKKIMDQADKMAGSQAGAPEHKTTETNGTEGPPGDGDGPTVEGMIDRLETSAANRLAQDIEDKMDDLMSSSSVPGEDLGDGEIPAPLDEDVLPQAQALSRMLTEIAIDLNMRDHRNLKRGRLDMRRLPSALASGSNRIFRRRQPDLTDETKLAVHIMVDVSGSMMGRETTALTAGFVVAKACEMAGHKAKLTVFSVANTVVKNWQARKYSGRVRAAGGGTDPVPTLRQARRDFATICQLENIHNTMLCIITDGNFYDQGLIEKLKKSGTHVFVIGIATPAREINGVEDYAVVAHVSELPNALRSILKRLSLQIARDVRRRLG